MFVSTLKSFFNCLDWSLYI